MSTRATPRPPRWTEYMALDDILRAPRNPKNHNAQIIGASMSRFGVVEQMALDERTGRLVAGHGRLDELERARNSGDDPPEGVTTDPAGAWQVPVNRGWASRSDADAEAYLIVSNRSTELGGWDDSLVDVLKDLQDSDLLEFTGYTDDDVEKLVAEQVTRDGVSPDDFPSFDGDTIPTEHQCPACGYAWSGSSAPRGETSPADDPDDLGNGDDGSGFGAIPQER